MSGQSKAPTMRDVAERTGVSIQTVSAVINGKPGITRETQNRVAQAISELGYRPYAIARSLRTRQTHTIAFIVSDIANPSFSTMASALEDRAHLAGYSIMVYNTHDDPEREERTVQAVMERWTDGVVLVPAEDTVTTSNVFQRAGIPVVALDRVPQGFEGPLVTLDHFGAGRVATEHLISLGHRELAHLSGRVRLSLARERRRGFLQALEEHGLAPLACSADGSWDCQSGYLAMREILACNHRPTGVFAANDRMAIGAIKALGEAGMRIPDDVSIVGVDDIEVSGFQSPPLTTVRQPFAEMATCALDLLLQILAGQSAGGQHIIPPELIVRGSTAPAKQE